jgi:hypothetical protein
MDNKFDKFLCETGLYEKLDISIDDMDDITEFLRGQAKPDVFCVECKENRVFNGKVNKVTIPKKDLFVPVYHEGNPELNAAISHSIKERGIKHFQEFVEKNRITTMKYQCSKDDNHQLVYVILLNESYIMKIGQYPSYRDIESPQMKKFQKVLGKYYLELSTAIRLYSVNVGIGSFVYLRRIIEKLVYDTFKEAEAAGKLTEQQFEFQADGQHRNGMEEKIKLLKGSLPDMITDHPKIYGVVSMGIHELSEEECLKCFPVLKDGIVMILDDIVAKKEKEKAAEEYKKSLGKIISDLK